MSRRPGPSFTPLTALLIRETISRSAEPARGRGTPAKKVVRSPIRLHDFPSLASRPISNKLSFIRRTSAARRTFDRLTCRWRSASLARPMRRKLASVTIVTNGADGKLVFRQYLQLRSDSGKLVVNMLDREALLELQKMLLSL